MSCFQKPKAPNILEASFKGEEKGLIHQKRNLEAAGPILDNFLRIDLFLLGVFTS